MPDPTRPLSVGLPWYRAESYAELREGLADGARLPPRYGTWLMSAEQVAGELERGGVAVVRVAIEPRAFAAWCGQRGLAQDAAARALYASEVADGRSADAADPVRD